jgi:hypothetical protein
MQTVAQRIESNEMLAAAESLLELRETFTRRDGRPDLTGTTYPYRQAVGTILTEARVRPEDRSRVLAALRYHVGNLLRARLTPEELAEWGLVEASPRQQSADAQARRAKLWRMTMDAGEVVDDPMDAVEAVLSATNLLEAVAVDPKGMDKTQRQVYLMAVERLTQVVGALPR